MDEDTSSDESELSLGDEATPNKERTHHEMNAEDVPAPSRSRNAQTAFALHPATLDTRQPVRYNPAPTPAPGIIAVGKFSQNRNNRRMTEYNLRKERLRKSAPIVNPAGTSKPVQPALWQTWDLNNLPLPVAVSYLQQVEEHIAKLRADEEKSRAEAAAQEQKANNLKERIRTLHEQVSALENDPTPAPAPLSTPTNLYPARSAHWEVGEYSNLHLRITRQFGSPNEHRTVAFPPTYAPPPRIANNYKRREFERERVCPARDNRGFDKYGQRVDRWRNHAYEPIRRDRSDTQPIGHSDAAPERYHGTKRSGSRSKGPYSRSVRCRYDYTQQEFCVTGLYTSSSVS